MHLVTVVPIEAQRTSGQELLVDFKKQAEHSFIDVRADVVVSPYHLLQSIFIIAFFNPCLYCVQVRGSSGLLECMEQYVISECKPGATLAVMGSVELTSNVFDSVVVRQYATLSLAWP